MPFEEEAVLRKPPTNSMLNMKGNPYQTVANNLNKNLSADLSPVASPYLGDNSIKKFRKPIK